MALYDYRDVLGPAEDPDPRAVEAARRFNAWEPDPATTAETSFADLDEDPGSKR